MIAEKHGTTYRPCSAKTAENEQMNGAAFQATITCCRFFSFLVLKEFIALI
jgi:hypothetical protein